MTKAELRAIYINRRKEISESEYLQFNQGICEQFFSSIDLSSIKVIHTFLPISRNHEPDTWLIINRLKQEFPNIQLSIPRINKKTDLLENFFFEELQQLEENNWGITQPKQGVFTDSEKIDLVLVPLLAFDTNGHRVGYGKGYYDYFLASCRPDCKKIGLSLFPPAEEIPVEPQDVKLDYCITPEKIYSF